MKQLTREERDNLILEDKELTIKHSDGEVLQVIVAGCIRSVGVTLVNKNNLKDERFCLNINERSLGINHYGYDKLFDLVQDGIINGVLDCKELFANCHNAFSGMSACGFKQ